MASVSAGFTWRFYRDTWWCNSCGQSGQMAKLSLMAEWPNGEVAWEQNGLRRSCSCGFIPIGRHVTSCTGYVFAHQFLAQMLEAKVSWLLYIGRLVFKLSCTHCTCLVKQANKVIAIYGFHNGCLLLWGWRVLFSLLPGKIGKGSLWHPFQHDSHIMIGIYCQKRSNFSHCLAILVSSNGSKSNCSTYTVSQCCFIQIQNNNYRTEYRKTFTHFPHNLIRFLCQRKGFPKIKAKARWLENVSMLCRLRR